jgi:hypothetical protein
VAELIAELGSYSYSFIKTVSDHVILDAMRQMEGFYDKDAIVRFYETEGRDGDVTVEFLGRFAPLSPICLRMYFRDGPARAKPLTFT